MTRCTMRPTESQPMRRSPGDQRLGHLLGQPRQHVLEVARAGRRAGARPGHRLEAHDAAVRAAQLAHLTLDHAPVGPPRVEVAPAYEPAVIDLQLAARLAPSEQTRRRRRSPTVTTIPSAPNATPKTDAPGRTQQPLDGGSDAYVVLLSKSLSFNTPAACIEGGGASTTTCPTPASPLPRPTPRNRRPERDLSGRLLTPTKP